MSVNNEVLKALAGSDVEMNSRELYKVLGDKVGVYTHAEFVTDVLTVMQERNQLYYSTQCKWGLASYGRLHLAKKTSVSVAGSRYVPPKSSYAGEELRATCQRTGAYDFLACPSLMNGQRVKHSTHYLAA